MKTNNQLARWQSHETPYGITAHEVEKQIVSSDWTKYHVSNQIFPFNSKDNGKFTTTIDSHINKSVPRSIVSDMFQDVKHMEGAVFINPTILLKQRLYTNILPGKLPTT
ncbi:MAG: hypothetical protein AAFQ94_05715 [Bacteroidota bacterium]